MDNIVPTINYFCFDEPDDDNKLDCVVPSEKTNDINDLTKAPEISLQYDKPHNNNEVNIIVTSENTYEVNDFTNFHDIPHYKEQDDHTKVAHSVVIRNTNLGVEKQVYSSNQKITNALDSLKFKKTY